MIIFVAEKTIYISEDNMYIKHYLCKILSKNEAFQDPKFWLQLIDTKIEMVTEKNVQAEIEIKKSLATIKRRGFFCFIWL